MSHLPLNIATCPVTWNNNDLPGWRELVPFPDVLDRMIEAGYTATEYDEKFGLEPDQVLAETRSRGITLCGSYQWLDLLHDDVFATQIDGFRDRLALLQALDCRNVIIADALRPERVAMAGNVPRDGSASLADEGYRNIAGNASQAAAIAAEYDIAAHYHNHVGTWIETPNEVATLLPHLRDAGIDLCFDTGHYAYGGGDAAAFLAEHLVDTGYLHLKDVDTDIVREARQNGWSFLEALRQIVFAPIGIGDANIPTILDTLVDGNFSGWVVIEQDTCAGDQTINARKNLDFVIQYLAKRMHP